MTDLHHHHHLNLNLPQPHYFAVPASLVRRFFAFVLDLFVVQFFLLGPFQGVFGRFFPPEVLHNFDFQALRSMLENNPQLSSTVFFLSLGAGAVALLYFSLLQFFMHKTIGMHLLGIDLMVGDNKHGVQGASSLSSPLSFWQCFVRNLFVIPVFPFIIFWIIDPLFMFFNQHHQRLLEKWSRTRMIQMMEL